MLDFHSPVTVKDSRAHFHGVSAFTQVVPHSYLGPSCLYINPVSSVAAYGQSLTTAREYLEYLSNLRALGATQRNTPLSGMFP